jgi:hypothetical protein
MHDPAHPTGAVTGRVVVDAIVVMRDEPNDRILSKTRRNPGDGSVRTGRSTGQRSAHFPRLPHLPHTSLSRSSARHSHRRRLRRPAIQRAHCTRCGEGEKPMSSATVGSCQLNESATLRDRFSSKNSGVDARASTPSQSCSAACPVGHDESTGPKNATGDASVVA